MYWVITNTSIIKIESMKYTIIRRASGSPVMSPRNVECIRSFRRQKPSIVLTFCIGITFKDIFVNYPCCTVVICIRSILCGVSVSRIFDISPTTVMVNQNLKRFYTPPPSFFPLKRKFIVYSLSPGCFIIRYFTPIICRISLPPI